MLGMLTNIPAISQLNTAHPVPLCDPVMVSVSPQNPTFTVPNALIAPIMEKTRLPMSEEHYQCD